MNINERGTIGDALYYLRRSQTGTSFVHNRGYIEMAIKNLESIAEKYDDKTPRRSSSSVSKINS